MGLNNGSLPRRRSLALGLAVSFVALVGACSSGPEATPTVHPPIPVGAVAAPASTIIPDAPAQTPTTPAITPVAPTSVPPAQTPTPTPTPTPLIVLRTAETGGWTAPLDPHHNTSAAFHGFFGNIYSGLVRWRTDGDLGRHVRVAEPDLAESWTQPDLQTFDFTLRGDARWHNVNPAYGRLVTADDVVTSIRRLFESEHRALWRRVGSVTALDTSTVRITLTGPHPGFLTQLASGFNVIVLPELIDGPALREDSAVGTGPFVFDVAASHFLSRGIAHRHNEFYEPDAPRIDRLERIVAGDQRTAVTMFRTGVIDFLAVGPDTIGEAMDSRREIETFRYASGAGWALTFKQTPPFDDPRARRAADLAIDRARFWATYSQGSLPAEVGLGMPLPGPNADLAPEEADPYFTFDPATATAVLDQIGPAAAELFVVSIPDLGESQVDAAMGLVRGLRQVGFSVEPNVMPASLYAATVQAPPGLFEVALGPVGSPPEADLWLHERFGPGGAFNLIGATDPAFASLIAAQRMAANPENRAAALRQAQLHILEAAYQPMIFLDQTWIVAHPGWSGWPRSFLDEPFQRFLREMEPST